MQARFIGVNIESGDQLPNPGDIGIGAANYHHSLLVRCPHCSELEVVNIVPGVGKLCWTWDQSTLTMHPSYLIQHYTGCVCHWTLVNGVFTIYPDSVKPQ